MVRLWQPLMDEALLRDSSCFGLVGGIILSNGSSIEFVIDFSQLQTTLFGFVTSRIALTPLVFVNIIKTKWHPAE